MKEGTEVFRRGFPRILAERECYYERGARPMDLEKWLPYLWIPPLALILLLAAIAYFAR
jgi:hypothetical protein